MNILKKLMTAMRGGAREIGEAVIDANALRIFEQEIEDARNHLDTARESLTEVMAKEMQTKRDIKALKEKIAEHEDYARQALKKENETLALEIAEKIAALEEELKQQKELRTRFEKQADKVKAQIRKAEKTIAEHERQLLMVKTTDSVQKATIAVTENIAANSSHLNSAKESLERIRKKQQQTEDKLAAGEELAAEADDGSLTARMEEAGINVGGSNSASVLERLKKDL